MSSIDLDPIAYMENRYGIRLTHQTKGEYAGPCPWCGGEDRFHVWEKGNYWCRPGPGHCGRKGWVDDLAGVKLSDHERRLLVLEREQKRQKRKLEEHETRLDKIERLQRTRPDLQYHKNLTDEAIEYWSSEGIYPHSIDRFKLGYCYACPTYTQSPSYTIPVYSYDNQLVNVRHRLVHPEAGKYRPQMPGLGQSIYNANTLKDPHERIIIVEGEKKSIVLSQHGFTSVGLMGKSFKWKTPWFEWFRKAGKIVIALDPDATESALTLGALFRKQHFKDVSVARFPVKPDDAIVQCGAKLADIEKILQNARKV